jgi:hypothetical protein
MTGRLPRVVYIAHKLRGKDRAEFTENVADAARYCAIAARAGIAPIAPYVCLDLGDAFHDDNPHDRNLGLAIDLLALDRCDEIWLCGPVLSRGMSIELDHAKTIHLRSRRFETLEAAAEWTAGINARETILRELAFAAERDYPVGDSALEP